MDSSEDHVSGAASEFHCRPSITKVLNAAQQAFSTLKQSPVKSGRKSRDDSSGFACFIIMVLIIVIIVQLWLFSLLYIQLKHRKDGEKKTEEKENIFVLPSEYRLPRNVTPLSYELVLKIYLPFYVDFPKEKNLTVDGEVRINMLVRESTNVIVLNQAGISIEKEKCSVYSHDNAFVVERLDYDHTHERVSFYLNDVLPSGQTATLKVSYTARVLNGTYGLYQNLYVSNNKIKIAAVTKMEPTSARKLVPCFDEPDFKAVWKVTIVHPVGTTAIANAMELDVSNEPGGEWKKSAFKPTPIMSSYLLAVFVSEFTYNEARTNRGVRVRLWSAPGSESQRDYGLKVATTALSTFEKYFGLNEVMLKQDLVALENFGSGAMENWGLITFRRKYLLDLAVPNASLTSEEQSSFLLNKYNRHMDIESVVTHELTHQWFGNLVTLAWWEELWLNEGFAAYFENLRLVSPGDDELAIVSYYL
ncbi:unnamed protein product [Cylicocyclus nassatus]|uniref:Uncharacterized protein n=1 Tax=Cylicocyclus nassatus TaxID=53992 RepID=A0AA36MBC4_CYLNA|nr:unnamed protein product [Cylicocyclus nassatus]